MDNNDNTDSFHVDIFYGDDRGNGFLWLSSHKLQIQLNWSILEKRYRECNEYKSKNEHVTILMIVIGCHCSMRASSRDLDLVSVIAVAENRSKTERLHAPVQGPLSITC
jgi:hypothetical protein